MHSVDGCNESVHFSEKEKETDIPQLQSCCEEVLFEEGPWEHSQHHAADVQEEEALPAHFTVGALCRGWVGRVAE